VKRFRFPLQRVLRVREIEEEVALAGWRDAEGEARRARDATAAVRAEIASAEDELLAMRGGEALDLPTTLLSYRRIDDLGLALVRARERERVASAEAERRRVAWDTARSARRAIEKLGERRRETHVAQELRREELERDDLASARVRPAARRSDGPAGPARPSSRTAAAPDSCAGPILPKDAEARPSGNA
jgi:flagellar export protein FliJ